MSDLRLSLLAIGIVVLIGVYFISGRTVRKRARREFKLRNARSHDAGEDDVLRDYYYEPVVPSPGGKASVPGSDVDHGAGFGKATVTRTAAVFADDIVAPATESGSGDDSMNIAVDNPVIEKMPGTPKSPPPQGASPPVSTKTSFTSRFKSQNKPAARAGTNSQAASGVQDLLVIMFVIARGEPFTGIQIDNAMTRLGLERDLRGMYQLYVEDDNQELKQMLGVANALEPGVIDFDHLASFRTTGLVVFMQLPGPWAGLDAFDRMFEGARALAAILDGEVRDDRQSVLTVQTLGHLREKIHEHELRIQLAQGRSRPGALPRF